MLYFGSKEKEKGSLFLNPIETPKFFTFFNFFSWMITLPLISSSFFIFIWERVSLSKGKGLESPRREIWEGLSSSSLSFSFLSEKDIFILEPSFLIFIILRVKNLSIF